MTSAGTVTVEVQGRDVNLVALLSRLESQMRQTDQVGIRLAQTTGGTFTAAQQKAANAAITEAQAMARAAVSVGDNARAHSILVNALGNSAGATDKSVASLTTSIARLQSGKTLVTEFGAAAKSSLLSIVGPAALVTTAIGGLSAALRGTGEAIAFKANLDATTSAVRAQLVGLRASSAVFSEGQAFANRYKLTQQELTDALQTSVSVMRVSNASTTDILNTFARLVTLAPDKTIADAARATRELAAGDVTSIKELFNVSAANAHKMKNEIQAGGDAIQVITKFLDTANVGMQGLESKATGVAGALKEVAIAQERFKLAVGGEAGGPALGIWEAYKDVLIDITAVLSGDTSQVEARTAARDAAQQAYNAAIQQGKTDTEALAAAQAVLTSEMQGGAAAALLAQRQGEQLAGVENAESAISIAAGLAAQRHGEQLLGMADAAAIAARMLQQSADTSLVDSQAKQLEALQTQLLNEQTLNTVNAFLAANPAINASGIQAAVTAGAISPLIGRLAELTLQIRLAKAELGGIALGRPETGGDAIARSLNGAAASQRYLAEQSERAAAAQRQQVLATGTHAQKVKILQDDYNRLSRIYGANSEQAINAQTKLIQAQQAGAKAAKGAGATRLSDQQKLNNSLLADQERAAQQSEEAARRHEQRLVDIEAEFQKKSLEQQRANEVSKRQSRADFYDKLTTDTKDIGPQVAQELSAAYEAAYAEAQKIAQAGNQKLADDYLKMKQRQIQAEEEYQKRLADARKAKDKSEVERLQQVHKLQTEANAEEEKQLLAGGDANVNARNEALADEQRNFEEAQGRMGTAAENAAERKVNAAIRSGKAVDAENAKLREQEQIYNRMAGGKTTTGAAAPGAPVPGTPTTATPAALPDLTELAQRLQSIVDAIFTIGGNITKAQGETTGAIGRLGPRLSGA